MLRSCLLREDREARRRRIVLLRNNLVLPHIIARSLCHCEDREARRRRIVLLRSNLVLSYFLREECSSPKLSPKPLVLRGLC